MNVQGSKLRKYLFFGLTSVLAAAFVFLAIQGRRMEKERQMDKPAELVRNYAPTPIRVLSPQDLLILSNSMNLERDNHGDPLAAVRHGIEIQNSGDVSYCEIQIQLDYLDNRGTVIASKTHSLKKQLPPGLKFTASDIPLDAIPVGAVDCRLSIIYADIAPKG
jgi:hypothetical protein